MTKKTYKNRDLKKLSDKVWEYVSTESADLMAMDIYDLKTSKILNKIEKSIKKSSKDADPTVK